jgi:hypothetical protein
VTCKAKASHLNCTASYDMSAMTAGNYTIEADAAGDGNYSPASGTSTLYVTGSSSGVHVSPVTMVAAPTTPAAAPAFHPAIAAQPAAITAPVIVVPDSSSSPDTDDACTDTTKADATCKPADGAAPPQ